MIVIFLSWRDGYCFSSRIRLLKKGIIKLLSISCTHYTITAHTCQEELLNYLEPSNFSNAAKVIDLSV